MKSLKLIFFAIGLISMISFLVQAWFTAPVQATTTIIDTNTDQTTPLIINHGDLLQINSGARLTMDSSLDNNGTINIMSGGTLWIDPNFTMTNHASGQINNMGEITANQAEIRNYGKFNHTGSILLLQSDCCPVPSDVGPDIINEAGAEFNSSTGSVLGGGLDAGIINVGKFNISGSIGLGDGGIIINSGEFDNQGHVEVLGQGYRNNGTINNSGSLSSDAAFYNDGVINNDGQISIPGLVNKVDGIINNYKGAIVDWDPIDNAPGGIANYGVINNQANLTNVQGGSLINSGTISNSGTLNNSQGSILDNTGGTIRNNCGGIFNNMGTFKGNPIENTCISNTTTVISSNTNVATLTINSGDTLQVNSGAQLNIATSLDNYGKINVQLGGFIGAPSGATIKNHENATINNHGEISTFLHGIGESNIINAGKINNAGIIRGGEIINTVTGTINTGSNSVLAVVSSLENFGKINNVLGASIGGDSGATKTNHVGATINNSGKILNGESVFDNYGKINNSGELEGADGNIINEVGGVINNSVGALITAEFEEFFANHGKINNRGTINVDSSSTFDNSGGTLRDICGGAFNNAGTFLGDAIIVSC